METAGTFEEQIDREREYIKHHLAGACGEGIDKETLEKSAITRALKAWEQNQHTAQ